MDVIVPIAFTFLTCIPSLIGIFFIKTSRRTILLLTSFAVGTFLGATFLKAFPKLMPQYFPIVLISFLIFIFLEELLHWHGEHFEEKRRIGLINLLGDFVHNFMDGLAIASSFRLGYSIGIPFTLSVLVHEIPQEIGDFSVLLFSGFSKKKAIIFNFLVSLSALIGTLFGWYSNLKPTILIAFVSGSFLYISSVDLIPLLRKEVKGRERLLGYVFFMLGILLMIII